MEFGITLARIEERLISVDKRINGSIDDITTHIEHGGKWRLAICIALIGLVGVFLTRAVGWGKMEQQIKVNTDRIAKMENNQNGQVSEVW
jgi:hypothetical protein